MTVDDQNKTPKGDMQQSLVEDFEEDEPMFCYYDALRQSIVDGIEDPDLMNEEDMQAAFSDEDNKNAEDICKEVNNSSIDVSSCMIGWRR